MKTNIKIIPVEGTADSPTGSDEDETPTTTAGSTDDIDADEADGASLIPSHHLSPLIAALREAQQECDLEALMLHLRMGYYVKSSIYSPFRIDNNPSWGIYKHKKTGEKRFHDWGIAKGEDGHDGDQISFLGQLLHIDEQENFKLLVDLFVAIANNPDTDPVLSPSLLREIDGPRPLPDRSRLGTGTQDQIERLSKLRGISVPGLSLAQARNVLVFGQWCGYEVFGVADASNKVIEVRRLDGKKFPAHGELKERKSHAIKNSNKCWPVGTLESVPYPCIALVEGLPDLLAAYDFILREQAGNIQCAPVGLLSATSVFTKTSLPHFANKIVHIFAHADTSGARAAASWKAQLLEAGATEVKIFDLSAFSVKDLNDLLLKDMNSPEMAGLKTVMPTVTT